jgi:hypothetical protein
MSKKSFRKIYKNIVKSIWFKKAYENKSIGETIEIKDSQEIHSGYYSDLVDKHFNELI